MFLIRNNPNQTVFMLSHSDLESDKNVQEYFKFNSLNSLGKSPAGLINNNRYQTKSIQSLWSTVSLYVLNEAR